MPPVANLSHEPGKAVRVVFASGIAELNRAMLAHFSAIEPEVPLCVVSEFEPEAGEWIAWHVHRSFEQNIEYVRTALAGRRIVSAAVAYDRRAAMDGLRRAAGVLAPGVLNPYDEDMRMAAPGSMTGFLLQRQLRSVTRQFRTGGRTRTWLRRIAHPMEAEIPIRARLAQARGLAAAASRPPAPVMATLADAAALEPGITIVIPTRDGRELLREMLPPLLSQLPQEQASEIFVVDNGSTDGTADWLTSEYPAIHALRYESPLSFARAVNMGIRQAHYSRTLLLNNDMIAEPGFVNALARAFTRVPDLFCATAQILFPPGVRREETGKTVWRSVNALDFPVRCDEPVSGEDLTWVLYGSGGCSLFDTAKLLALGCVAELYDPAYVEDLDFGYRAWKLGWPSVYCSEARVEHRHRSTTSRFYTERQIDFFVERNYLRFVASAVSERGVFERLWLEGVRRLQLQAMNGRGAALDALRAVPRIGPAPPAANGSLTESEILALTNGDVAIFPSSENRPAHARTILVASPYVPFPLSHGGAVRIFNLMKAAAKTNNLILVAFCDDLVLPASELRELCSQIVLVRRHGSHYKRNTERPDTVEEFDSATFRACLKQAVHQWHPDVVQLEFTWMAQYADACHPAKTVLVEHDITFDLQGQLLATANSASTERLELATQLARWRTFETDAWQNVDCVVTMSPKDAESVVGARAVECLPNGVDCGRFEPVTEAPEPNRLLLIGSFAHLPNLLALEFLLREVWPRLGPGYTLHVIGGARHDYYLDYFRNRVSPDLAQAGVEVEGFVADVRGAYRRASIVLAPLTASAGTNIKVLEAMAMGKLVISTTAGVNGLDVAPGHDCIVADTAEEMAEEIRRHAGNEALRQPLESNARATALNYDWKAIGPRQNELYESLLAAAHPRDIQ